MAKPIDDRCCKCGGLVAVSCCLLGWCEAHWAEHDVACHEDPEVPDAK